MNTVVKNLPVIILSVSIGSAFATQAQPVKVPFDLFSGIYSRPDSAIKFRQVTRSLELPQKDDSKMALGGQTWGIAWGDANNNLYPDLYLNHHTQRSTGRPEVLESHLIYDLGAPDRAVAHIELNGYDQHTAIFIDINGDGQQDIFELQGGQHGLASEPGPEIENQVFIGENGAFPADSTALSYDLQYPLGRGRNPTPLNIKGELGLVLANAPRPDGQYPTTFYLRTPSGIFEERREYFRVQACATKQPSGEGCSAQQTADLQNFYLALSGFFNSDEYQDVIFLGNKAGGRHPTTLFTGEEDGTFSASPFTGPDIRVRDAVVLDANNDGMFDLWLVGKQRKTRHGSAGNGLYLFGPEGRFLRQPLVDSVSASPPDSISVVAGDFDNDGDQDVVTYEAAADHTFHFSIWENFDGGRFRRTSFFDSDNPGYARNVAAADYNLDGSLDLIFGDGSKTPEDVKGIGGYVLLEGQPTGNNWLQIDLVDPMNLQGLGARVYVTSEELKMIRGQFGGVHEATQNHNRLHFGLGASESSNVSVLWNDGTVTELKNVAVNQVLRISYPGAF